MKKSFIKTSLCTALATAIISAGTSFAPKLPENASAEDLVLKYEFEDGTTSGGKIHSSGWKGNTKEDGSGVDFDLTKYSGNGFSYLDQKGTTVSVEVDVPEAGLYELTICYCEPSDPNKKVQYLNINGINQGEVSFPHNLTFEETSGGIVNLQKGKNTIELKAYWGYTYFDYLTIKPADEKLTNLSPTRTLSNPNASDSAKRLYNYLCDQYGNHIISGQQEYCGEHNYNLWSDPNNFIKDNEAEFEYILEKTGKQPAIRGIDLLNYRSNSPWTDHAPERAIQWVNEYKGIATLTWHWNVPSEEGGETAAFYVESTGNSPYTTFSVKNALKEGTWEHKQILADIDVIAKELTKLKEADVPVLWRPLHEAEGAWFWWGAEGPEACKELYRLLYDKLTNEYGLDNLIWVWTGYTYPTSSAWYPGDDVVDIVGYDKYNAVDGMPNLSSISSTFYSLVQSTDGQKMVAMSENDSIPSLENLVNDKAAWLYFCPWYMNYLTSEQNNPVEELVKIYTSDYCITLDELPDLKSYPISEEKPPVSSGNEENLWGDANCDGQVDMSDAVLIMQSLSNPDKYGLNGTDDSAITKQGLINADVFNHGDGVTNNDALEIQKYKLDLITGFDIN
ncbi:MAG: glycoside hydrolase [Ruminococcus flavefaciens]|nr:glycoside hydrolase [Ruminococcus flavefaciens]MCM1059201.1 glycoside hydrolase [Eubacterium sp.]